MFPYPHHSHIAGYILMDGAGDLAGGRFCLLYGKDIRNRLRRGAVNGVPIGKPAIEIAGNFHRADLSAFAACGTDILFYIASFFQIVDPKIPFFPFNFG